MDDFKIPDLLVTFIQVLKEDKDLKEWFVRLDSLPENLRASELGQIKVKMREASEDINIVELVGYLKNRDIFKAVLYTIREFED